MDINSIMSKQVAELQQTLQMSLMDKTLNIEAAGAVQLLEQFPQQTSASYPYKGTVINVSV